MPIINDYEDENGIYNVMEQVDYDVHAEPDDKDDKNTGKDDEIDGHDNRDDNKEPEEGEEGVANLLDDILIEESPVESQNIEHQQTSDEK